VLWFYFPRPKRLLRKNSPPHVRHIGKPDIDNLAKAVMDALYQDGWFVDDSIVFAVNATKCYVSLSSSMPQSRPGAWIEVFAEEKP
jgi:Holliday junction resolvase RusA-like endonuclease